MNSPRSRIDDASISAFDRKDRGRSASQTSGRSRALAVPSDRSAASIDARDDASDAGSVRSGTEHPKPSSSASSRTSRRDADDDKSISSATSRLTREQVQKEGAFASSLSVASRSQRSAGSGSAPRTYADEYLRAALTPQPRRHKTLTDPSSPFPSAHSVGMDEEDPPEITSIPTDEIVDSSYASSTQNLEESLQINETLMRGSHETVMRGSRDRYTFGRLQARASKRRELLEKVNEDEDLSCSGMDFRARRLRNVRSLYVRVEEDGGGTALSTADGSASGYSGGDPSDHSASSVSSMTSPSNASASGAGRRSSRSDRSVSVRSVRSDNARAGGVGRISIQNPNGVFSPANGSTVGNFVGGPRNHFAENVSDMRSPSNASAGAGAGVVGSPTSQSIQSGRQSPTNDAPALGSPTSIKSGRVSAIGNTHANPINSPVANSVASPVVSPTSRSVSKLSTIEQSVGSPTNASTVASPTNRSAKSTAKGISIHSLNNASALASPTNSQDEMQSTKQLSTIENSIGSPSNQSVTNSIAFGSAATENNATVQSFGRKSTATGSKSDEISEYRMKLFAKMLHLLDDVEHPGMHGGSTKDGSRDERSYEYSIAELKLIQKRTEEEMSRIMNEFDRSKRNALRASQKMAGSKDAALMSGKESNGDQEVDSEDEKGPPPDKIMLSEAIASKLSDITSPTACQDGSGVYLDVSSNNYYCVVENNDDEEGPRNLPPRPSSPRKKKHPTAPVFEKSAVPMLVGEEGLPIVRENLPSVQENSEGAVEYYKSVTGGVMNECLEESPLDEMDQYEQQSVRMGANKSVPQCEAYSTNSSNLSPGDEFNGASDSAPENEMSESGGCEGDEDFEPKIVEADLDEIMFQSGISQNKVRDRLLAASRSAARRTVKKERKQAEDLFHEGIMNAVSAAEEMQKLEDELMEEVYGTFGDELPALVSMGDPILIEGSSVQGGVDASQEGLNQEGLDQEVLSPEVSQEGVSQQGLPFGNQMQQPLELNVPTHEQCGCLVQ